MYNIGKLYPFEVFSSVQNGKEVYFLDRKEKEVVHVNSMEVGSLCEVLKCDDENRYEFWSENPITEEGSK